MTPKIAVILTDAQRRILWVNEDFTAITGYPLAEVIGRKPSLLQGPRTDQQAIHRIRKGLESLTPFKEQILNYRKNGEEYPCQLVIHPIFNLQQQLTHFIAFEIDGNEIEHPEELPLLQLNSKYSSSSLKGIDEIRLYTRLRLLMEEEELFLDPNLSLRTVADRLGTNTKYLSQVINHHSSHNFQHFINDYRIEQVKKKISSPKYRHLTLYGIALKCGFKNKSTFFKVFREITGSTPRDFLRSPGHESDHPIDN